MADSPPDSDSDGDPRVASRAGSNDRTPRWVKVFALVVLAVVVLAVVVILTGRGGGHGPSRHASAAATSFGHTPPPGVEHGDREA